MQLDTTTVGTMSELVTGRDLSRDAMVVQYVACILVYYVRGQGLAVAFSSRSRRLKIGSVCPSVWFLVHCVPLSLMMNGADEEGKD